MGTSLKGQQFSFDGITIEFFGAIGTKLGKKWGFNALGGSALSLGNPETMLPEIRECIAGDVSNGNSDKVAQVQLGARQAVVLFLEGVLTREHLVKAKEGKGYIDMPKVKIDNRELTIRVFANPKHGVATADRQGNIL